MSKTALLQLSLIAKHIAEAGGRALLVGGCVRDGLLGIPPKDLDVEVFGLSTEALKAVLAHFGPVKAFGASFPVLGVAGLPVDFSLPRGPTFPEAARHRDLTINSMGRDLLTGELLDPHGGQTDLAAGRLRATDPARFGTDPVRGVRVAQLAARLGLRPDAALLDLCRQVDLSGVAPERLWQELTKLLLRAERPSVGLEILRQTGQLRFFPELAALPGVPQEPEWHPEGDVWVHTLRVVDEAARLRDGAPRDLALMFGALLHDVGKPPTTQHLEGRIRSRGHDVAGVPLAESFLTRLRAPHALVAAVGALVRHHLAPALLPHGHAGDRAYRRLVRGLQKAGVEPDTLLAVARADHWGRTTEDARLRRFDAADTFAARIAALDLRTPVRDVVLGRHLLARGLSPGPHLGDVLRACRDVQDQTGWRDPEQILDRVLCKPG
jgi:tRNA nucleotidyltransferase (CCA-adding enzyme)